MSRPAMAGLYDGFTAAWRAAIAAAWPEVVPQGIWDVRDAARLPYDAATGTLVTPFATLDIPALTRAEDYGIGNRVWEAQVRVYYIMEMAVADGGAAGALRGRLEALADTLDANGLSVGQLIPPDVDLAEGDYLAAPNQLLLMLNATQRVGMVTANCVLALTPS